MRRVLSLTVLLAALLLSGCSDSTAPAKIEVEGAWTGTVTGTSGTTGTLSLTLTETSGTVSGTGNLAAPSQSIALTASGTYAAPNVSLTLTASGFEALNLTATVTKTQMTGTLNGSGFLNSAVTLTRQ